jgi:CPA1 family monovalent cation:H+ antiporter
MGFGDWILLVSSLLAVAVLLGVLALRTGVPLTVVLAAIGFLAGWLLPIEGPLQGEQFEEVLVFVFLPILVFEAALGLSTRAFFRNLIPIFVLAIPALVVSSVLVGLALNIVLGTPLIAALLFGSLISATDPVAVVAIFRDLGVPRRLLTLVEGESLLNDGVAIVLVSILLAASLGGDVNPSQGTLDFVVVFFGGAALGAGVGSLAALVLPWLDRLAASALSLAIAYGGFVLAEDVFGFSGVTATVATGLVLGGTAPFRASEPVRELWEGLWEALGYVANALLFLLIGLAIDPELLADNVTAIGLAIIAVLIARAAAVVPLMSLLERVAGIPSVGLRNEAVVVWGGLRGGVALALALALPESLPQRDQFVAMTGGVVLVTLLLNATTIGLLVRRLGLDQPSTADRFLAGSARLSAIAAARARLEDLNLEDRKVSSELDAAEEVARAELMKLSLDEDAEIQVISRRGLIVERQTYQHLSDSGLLPPPVARTLQHEVDDDVEELTASHGSLESMRPRDLPRFDRILNRITSWLPTPLGEDPMELAYAEASARRLAAKRTGEALALFSSMPNIDPAAVDYAMSIFADREERAVADMAALDTDESQDMREVRHRQAEVLMRVASTDALEQLADIGLLPRVMANQAAEQIVEDEEE